MSVADRMQTLSHVLVPMVADFAVSGDGAAPAWNEAPWLTMARVGGKGEYQTRAKVLYSELGLYVLVECQDRVLTCSGLPDHANLFTEDVVEVFLWPDRRQNLYFEYEISPLNSELPILVPNHDGRFHGWLPWQSGPGRRTRHQTSVIGGPRAPGASVQSWMVEFFLPFALFTGLGHVPPEPGTRWRANFYRIDYDLGKPSQWAWCTLTSTNFHDFRRFGEIEFA